MHYLADLQIWKSGALQTLYFGSIGVVHDGHVYLPRIAQPALYGYAMGLNRHPVQFGYGELTLANADRGLDQYAHDGWDGRAITLYLYDPTTATVVKMFSGTVLHTAWDDDTVVVTLRDKPEDLSRPLSTALYGGTNRPVDSAQELDGTPEGIKGQRKPLLFGVVENITPVRVNPELLIYQVSDGAIGSVAAVYDHGKALAFDRLYTDQMDLQGSPPTAGGYSVWLGGGYFRLTTPPTGELTCDAIGAGSSFPGSVISQIAARLGVTASAACVSALDSGADYGIGLWGQDLTGVEALEAVMQAAHGYWYFDRDNVLCFYRLPYTVTGGYIVLTRSEIGAIRRVGIGLGPDNLPASALAVEYARNYTAQTGELDSSVTPQRKAWLQEEYRTIQEPEIVEVIAAHPFAQEWRFTTPIFTGAGAVELLARLVVCHSVDRDVLSVDVNVSDLPLNQILDLLTPGCELTVQMDEFGYSAGRPFVCIAFEQDAEWGRLTLTLWG